MECLTSLVGIKDLCADNLIQPLFYLDDAQGVDRNSLSDVARSSIGSGLKFGQQLIESASRFLVADMETIIPKGYSIKSSLNSFCNNCSYTSLTSSTTFTGVIIKNSSVSKNTYLSVDSLKVMIKTNGTFTIVLDDGITPKQISHQFTSGIEVTIINVNYKTQSKSIKVYFLEPGVAVSALSCPVLRSCGCSGTSNQSKDIQIKGLLGNVEFTTQYGFIPCASVICSMDNLICSIVNQQPRLFALALFYRSVAGYFAEFPVTKRNNRNASFDEEEKVALSDEYMGLYYERLRGSKNIKGISDNMTAALNNLGDPCVICQRITGVSWAVG